MKRKSIKFVSMTIREAGRLLLHTLQQVYDAREAANITDLVLENITGLQKMDRATQRDIDLGLESVRSLQEWMSRLASHEPVQYVLGEAWFFGLPFLVDHHVLIPRPETEELVQWVLDDSRGTDGPTIFDIGTGSGCIPISLKKKFGTANVFACDISEGALAVAKKNASVLQADVDFRLVDILDRNTWKDFPAVNMLVSNPPYIPVSEKTAMQKNVVAHEPHLALFVDDHDPLIFYKAIAELGARLLVLPGKIYVETHEDLAKETAQVFQSAGYSFVEIRKDMQGKERLVKAVLLHTGLVDH